MRNGHFAILLLSSIAAADTGSASRYLAGEPATLLDVGLMRLENLMSEFQSRVGLHWTDNGDFTFFKAEVSSSYEPNDDKIYVYISAANDEPNTVQMAEGCENAMMQMNIWLLKSLPGLFLHAGQEATSTPPNFNSELLAMFEIRCRFSSRQDSSVGRFWASRTLGSLGDRQMRVGKWKMLNE